MAVYKVIKTQLGCVELGMHCGKIVWCGFGCASWAQNCRVVCPSGGSWAQNATQTCPEEGKSASRAQNCLVACPLGGSWAQNATQMCPEEERGVPEYSLDDLLRGRGSIFRWEDLQLQGTPLQLRVWQELFNLLPDELITYSELANRCGYPRAVRAVATAVGKNPVSLIIPCHRVVRKSGNYAVVRKTGGPEVVRNAGSGRDAASVTGWELGNYRWGKELKIRYWNGKG